MTQAGNFSLLIKGMMDTGRSFISPNRTEEAIRFFLIMTNDAQNKFSVNRAEYRQVILSS
jgi:hypothetical protein